MEWDPGPPASFKSLFGLAPFDECQAEPTLFRVHWGHLDLVASKSPLEAVITFGAVARHVAEQWPRLSAFKPARFFHLTHPTAPLAAGAPANWSASLAAVAAQVTADKGGVPDLTPYAGPDFKPQDALRVPLRDFAFGAATWMGNGDMAARKDQGGTRAILWTALDAISN